MSELEDMPPFDIALVCCQTAFEGTFPKYVVKLADAYRDRCGEIRDLKAQLDEMTKGDNGHELNRRLNKISALKAALDSERNLNARLREALEALTAQAQYAYDETGNANRYMVALGHGIYKARAVLTAEAHDAATKGSPTESAAGVGKEGRDG